MIYVQHACASCKTAVLSRILHACASCSAAVLLRCSITFSTQRVVWCSTKMWRERLAHTDFASPVIIIITIIIIVYICIYIYIYISPWPFGLKPCSSAGWAVVAAERVVVAATPCRRRACLRHLQAATVFGTCSCCSPTCRDR
jgi:hypothetical protein